MTVISYLQIHLIKYEKKIENGLPTPTSFSFGFNINSISK